MTLSSLLKKVKDFFSNCDQIRRKLQIGSYLLKKVLMENFIFCVVYVNDTEMSHSPYF